MDEWIPTLILLCSQHACISNVSLFHCCWLLPFKLVRVFGRYLIGLTDRQTDSVVDKRLLSLYIIVYKNIRGFITKFVTICCNVFTVIIDTHQKCFQHLCKEPLCFSLSCYL